MWYADIQTQIGALYKWRAFNDSGHIESELSFFIGFYLFIFEIMNLWQTNTLRSPMKSPMILATESPQWRHLMYSKGHVQKHAIYVEGIALKFEKYLDLTVT